MINILCYGDSNTWGQIPGSMDTQVMLAKRFDRGVRWTSVLQEILGKDFTVIEAGLNGRNTSFDETRLVRPSRNGLATLPLILEMNYPLDAVVLMLGTNDAKSEFNASIDQTRDALQKMIRFIKNSHFAQNYAAPKVLLMAPAPMFRIDSKDFDLFYDDASIAKSKQYAEMFATLAKAENCQFLDAGKIVEISSDDGVHIAQASQAPFAKAVAEKIKVMFPSQ